MKIRFDQSAPYAVEESDVAFAKLTGAYEKAGGRIERVRFPGAKHGFTGQPSADTTKCIADMREFVGRQLSRKP